MNQALLDDADRIAVTDLYPARCRRVVANLAAALREQSEEMEEGRKYALALEEELWVRAEKTNQLLMLANSMDADFESYARAHPAAPDPAAIREAALEAFSAWFAKNYPKDTLIYDPQWHAPRIFRTVAHLIAKGAAE